MRLSCLSAGVQRDIIYSLGNPNFSLNGKRYNHFALSPQGRTFFKELLGLERVSPNAYLLVAGKGSVPAEIIFQETTTGQVFSFNLLNLSFEMSSAEEFSEVHACRREVVKQFFPQNQKKVTQVKLVIEEAACSDAAVKEELMQRFDFDGRLALLSLEIDNVFTHSDEASVDFQQVVCGHSAEIRGKDVVEIGAGTGVNLIYALRFGATSVWASEISLPYYLISQWNLQYAQQTGQLPPEALSKATLVHGSGFTGAPDSNVYLFNAPSIRAPEEIKAQIDDKGALAGTSCFISETDFIGLFDALKRRLTPEGMAIWRVFPLFAADQAGTAFTGWDENEMLGLLMFAPPEYAYARVQSGQFFRCQPEITTTRFGPWEDIFVIKKRGG